MRSIEVKQSDIPAKIDEEALYYEVVAATGLSKDKVQMSRIRGEGIEEVFTIIIDTELPIPDLKQVIRNHNPAKSTEEKVETEALTAFDEQLRRSPFLSGLVQRLAALEVIPK